MRIEDRQLLVWMTIFFIAMAYLESAVVVYLRELYCPPGSAFPSVVMPLDLVRVEVGREVATMVMLLAPAAMVARGTLVRFAWFCYGFGVWDLFYYVWLKLFVDWPSGLSDPDLLFLVPVPWVGPVWAPCLISVGLIVLALLLLRCAALGSGSRPTPLVWSLLIVGAILMVLSFVVLPWQASFSPKDLFGSAPSGNAWIAGLMAGGDVAPDLFAWPLFVAGFGLAGTGMVRLWVISRKGSTHGHVEKV